ncbi:hypothetical protein C8F04DRAFT_1194657 [Mycena alexandri]|uniref:Uncharacterized protein n=1 Tax=Mycena alexandri TaxID=1745969 RepID=A0AAD6S8D3_9AGAR|nr:hypothetical protein C8F04DRAFT_1194657 [Mycena alexandri]
MPAHTWTTPAQFQLLSAHMPEYIVRHAQKKVSKVWPLIFEDFFRHHPVNGMVGVDKASATDEQWQALQEAILMRRGQIKAWFRYQHRKTHRTTTARRSAQSTLSSTLFNVKPTRHRVHRVTEVFQKRNRQRVNEVLAERGHDELNEEHMAIDGEDLEAQETRTKAVRGARLRMHNEVVRELYEDAPEWEREAIAEAIREEKENMGASTEQSALEAASEQRQIAIDDSGVVMEKVLQTLADKTGWFSFAIWGGPNPRHGGDLSLKCAVYGNTPAGNDFIAQHANYDEGISLPFQEFLRRCFENGLLRPPVVPANAVNVDGLIPLDPEEDTPLAAENPAKTAKTKKTSAKSNARKARPKRVPKPRKAVAPPAPAPSATLSRRPLLPLRFLEQDDLIFGNDNGQDDMFPESLPSTSPSSPSTPVATQWPEGMSAPTSPRTAARNAELERGGIVATATYAAAVVDPVLLQLAVTPPRPRPCFNVAAFAPNHIVGGSPGASDPGGFRWGAPSAPHLEPFRRNMGTSQSTATSGWQSTSASGSTLPGLFGKYLATSPMRAYRDQLAYQEQVAARPSVDIFGLSPPPRPAAAAAPPAPSAAAPPAPPFVPAPAPAATTSGASTTTPVVHASGPAATPVYASRPMANPTKSAARAAKAAATGNSAAAVIAAAAKKRGKKVKRDALTDITNDIPDTPAVSDPTAAAPAPAAGDENVQLCVHQPGRTRESLRRAKEVEERAKATEAEQRRLASRLHNPDGNHDLVCVPALRRSGRDGKVPARLDEGYVGKVKTTRGELGGMRGPAGVELVKHGRGANTQRPPPKTKAVPAAKPKTATASQRRRTEKRTRGKNDDL